MVKMQKLLIGLILIVNCKYDVENNDLSLSKWLLYLEFWSLNWLIFCGVVYVVKCEEIVLIFTQYALSSKHYIKQIICLI